MKVIVYNATLVEKQHLAVANLKKHTVTMIGSLLDRTTVRFSHTKTAVMVLHHQEAIPAALVEQLAIHGIRFIAAHAPQPSDEDLIQFKELGIEYYLIPHSDAALLAVDIIRQLDQWENSD